MADIVDKETQKVFSDADHVRSMLGSIGWTLSKAKLDALIIDLQNINNLDLEKPETLATQLMGRKMASELLFVWLKDLYGMVEQVDVSRMSQKVAGDDYIGRHD